MRENSRAITLAEPNQTWLQMSEVSIQAAQSLLASHSCAEQLGAYDVAAFVFDCSRLQSFQEARLLLESVATASGNTMPCVLVAAKDDLGMHPVSPCLACRQVALPNSSAHCCHWGSELAHDDEADGPGKTMPCVLVAAKDDLEMHPMSSNAAQML